MRTLIALVGAVVLWLTVCGISPAAAHSGPVATTCVTVHPVYVLGHQVTGTYQVCVPTP